MILGILAALVVPRVLERPDEARVIAARSDIAAILAALKLYRLDNQRYPTSEQGPRRADRAADAAARSAQLEAERLPRATAEGPVGSAYQYLNPGLHGEIDVYSFGADGQPGGTGIDTDIGSWDL